MTTLMTMACNRHPGMAALKTDVEFVDALLLAGVVCLFAEGVAIMAMAVFSSGPFTAVKEKVH
jgi:hypothetical protein